MRKKLRKFWEDHHEAVITGVVGFTTTMATGLISRSVIKELNGRRPFYYSLVTEDQNECLPDVPIQLYEHQRNGVIRHASTILPSTDPNYISPAAAALNVGVPRSKVSDLPAIPATTSSQATSAA